MNTVQEMQAALPSPRKLFTPAVTGILVLSVLGFVLLARAPGFAGETFGLTARGLLHGKIWQLVTYPFLNGGCGLIFNGMLVLFIGSAIEREWRTKSFLALWLVVSVSCGLLWVVLTALTGFSAVGIGAGACGYGLIATMGLLFRGQKFLLFFATVKAEHIAIGLIAIGVILSLPMPIMLVWVTGALVAYLYVQARWSLRAKSSYRPASRRPGAGGQFVDID